MSTKRRLFFLIGGVKGMLSLFSWRFQRDLHCGMEQDSDTSTNEPKSPSPLNVASWEEVCTDLLQKTPEVAPLRDILLPKPTLGYKTAQGCLVVLEIPASARTNLGRQTATRYPKTAKFRCDRATVLAIRRWGTGEYLKSIASNWTEGEDKLFVYRLGQYVTEPEFDMDLELVCAKGIHFFLTVVGAYSWYGQIGSTAVVHTNKGRISYKGKSHKKSKKILKRCMKERRLNK